MNVRTYVRTYVCMYVCMCVCMYVMHTYVCACAAYVRVYVYMYARVHGWVYACVRCGARHCVAWVVWCACIVAMRGSVRRAPTHRHALNQRAGVTMHDAYGVSR